MAYSDRYLLFIEYFNAGKYMSAQATLDEVWLDETGEEKEFYGGLIQAAVALYHLTNGNPQGAKKVYAAARGMLLPCGERRRGLSVAKLLADLDRLFGEQVNEQDEHADYRGVLPKIEFDESCATLPSS